MTGWHMDAELARRYADGATRIDLTTSVEAHMMACGGCRDTLAAAVSDERLTSIWDGITTQIDARRPPLISRVATRLRLRAHRTTQTTGTYQLTDAPTSFEALPTLPERYREVAIRYYTVTHSLGGLCFV